MNKKEPQNNLLFDTKLSTKGFQEVVEITKEKLKLHREKMNNLSSQQRSDISYQQLNLFLFKINLIRINLTYYGNQIRISSKILLKGIIKESTKEKLINNFVSQFQKDEIQYLKSPKKEKEVEETFKYWGGYELSDILPPIKPKIKGSIIPLLVISLIMSISMSFLGAIFRLEAIRFYSICIIGGMFLFIFLNAKAVKIGSYRCIIPIKLIVFGNIFLLLFLQECFLYIIYYANLMEEKSFFSFLKTRYNVSFNFEEILYLGIYLSLIIFTYLFSIRFIKLKINQIQSQHIPSEAHDFVNYNFSLGKTDDEIRSLLAEKGWKKEADQNEMFKVME